MVRIFHEGYNEGSLGALNPTSKINKLIMINNLIIRFYLSRL